MGLYIGQQQQYIRKSAKKTKIKKTKSGECIGKSIGVRCKNGGMREVGSLRDFQSPIL